MVIPHFEMHATTPRDKKKTVDDERHFLIQIIQIYFFNINLRVFFIIQLD